MEDSIEDGIDVYFDNMPYNVREFIKTATRHIASSFMSSIPPIGKIDDDEFYVESPIELMFYVAAKSLLLSIGIPEYDGITWFYKRCAPVGFFILPQHKIGKYRVDFLIEYMSEDITRGVIVELDGHNFHDTTEKQRRYEKKRDRELIKMGYKIVHYTGKEITDNPYIPAAEAINMVIAKNPTINMIRPPREDVI